jgi:hypothetical protein
MAGVYFGELIKNWLVTLTKYKDSENIQDLQKP